MGDEEREGLQMPSHTLFETLLHPHVYTLSLPLYLCTRYPTSISAIVLLLALLFWRFLNRSTELLVGGLLLRSNDARGSKASGMVWYESAWRARLVHSMARSGLLGVVMP
jgi:hypothetical protein